MAMNRDKAVEEAEDRLLEESRHVVLEWLWQRAQEAEREENCKDLEEEARVEEGAAMRLEDAGHDALASIARGKAGILRKAVSQIRNRSAARAPEEPKA